MLLQSYRFVSYKYDNGFKMCVYLLCLKYTNYNNYNNYNNIICIVLAHSLFQSFKKTLVLNHRTKLYWSSCIIVRRYS